MLISEFLFRNAGRARRQGLCGRSTCRHLLCVAIISPQLRKRTLCVFGPACLYRSTGTVTLGPSLPRIQGGTDSRSEISGVLIILFLGPASEITSGKLHRIKISLASFSWLHTIFTILESQKYSVTLYLYPIIITGMFKKLHTSICGGMTPIATGLYMGRAVRECPADKTMHGPHH